MSETAPDSSPIASMCQTTFIGPLTDTIINLIVTELKKAETKEKIMTHIIDPLLADISTRYYPYFIMMIIVLIIIIILLISILILEIIKK